MAQHAPSAKKTGHRQALAREGTSRAPSPSFPPQSWSMAPGSGHPACPSMCRARARTASEGRAPSCAVPGTVLLLFVYPAYLALGTGVFWVLESPAAHDATERFQHDKWALLRNFTCLDGPALDLMIRVRGERGCPGRDGMGRGPQGDRAEGERALKREVEGIDAGTTGGARGRVGDERGGLDRRGKGPGSSERKAQRGPLSPLLGALRRDAWRQHPNLSMRTTGARLAGSGAGRAGPLGQNRGTARLAGLGGGGARVQPGPRGAVSGLDLE